MQRCGFVFLLPPPDATVIMIFSPFSHFTVNYGAASSVFSYVMMFFGPLCLSVKRFEQLTYFDETWFECRITIDHHY